MRIQPLAAGLLALALVFHSASAGSEPTDAALAAVPAEPAATPTPEPAAPAAKDPALAEAPISELYGALEQISAAPETDHATRAERLAPVVTASYDLPFMSAKVLGRFWSKLDQADQLRWIDTFSRLTIDTYAERFTGTGTETFEVMGVEPSSRDTVMVRTRIVPASEDPVSIDYRMHHRGGSWRIVDIYLNGTVSELALRRSEYSAVIKRDGLEPLIAQLDAKIEANAEAE